MQQQAGRGAPIARVGPGPGAGSIDLPAVAHCILDIVPCILPVNTLVVRLRGNKYLRRLASFSGPDRRRSSARFITDLAAVSSLLTTIACDILFLCFSRQPARNIQQRHGPALQAFELLHELVEQPGVLDAFGYSEEQVATTVLLLGNFVGARGLATCEPDAWAHRQRADRRAPAEEAPFLQPLLFQLLCRRLPLLALADCLACARFGFWSQDRRSFFPGSPPDQPSGLRWAVQTVRTNDFGVVSDSESARLTPPKG